MAEKKKKTTGLQFSEDVIATIAGIAASEIDGVAAMSGGVVQGIAERLGRKDLTKGVSVEVGKEEVAVDLKVIVDYGKHLPDVYNKVVQNIGNSVQQMTGLRVIEVNMFVEGVSFPEEQNQAVISQDPEQEEGRVL